MYKQISNYSALPDVPRLVRWIQKLTCIAGSRGQAVGRRCRGWGRAVTRILLLCLSFFSFPAFSEADETQLAVWANEAIVATYTYNYQNFLERQKGIAVYFTSEGWIAYSKALNDSKLPENVKKNNYYVSAVATMPPKIAAINDHYWQAVMPLLVVYKNPQYQQKQTLNVTLQFTVAPSGQGVRGFAITSLQAKQVTPTCECPADSASTQ